IDLDAIRHNVSEFRHRLPESCRLMATVKANAYGHGSVQVARAALAAGATHLAVAFLDEALELRKAGLQAPILTLGYTPARGIRAALEQDIALTVFDRESAETVIQEAKRAGGKARVHVKVDTGMGRLGIWEDQVLPLVQEWVREPHLEVEGLFT